MLIMQPAHNDRKLRPRLSLSYTRFEAPDDREFVIVYCLHEFRRLFMVCRRPQLHTLFWIGKPRRHHADDRVRLGVKMNGLIQDCGISAEASLPQSPAEDDRGTCRGLIDRKSTRLNSSHRCISYAVFCLK